MRRIALAATLLLACAAPAAYANKAQTSYSKQDFFQALNTAYGENWKRDGGHEAGRYGMSGKTSMEEVAGNAPGGTWRFNLNAACPFPDSTNPASYNYNKVMSFQMPAAAINNGNGMQYAFQTQAVNDLFVPHLQKMIADYNKDLNKEFRDMQVTLERPAGQLPWNLVATYNYDGGVKPADISKRLVFLMSKSKFLLCDIVTYSWLAKEKLWDELKGPVTTLSREQFLVLYPLFEQQGYAITNSNVAGGAWQMGNGKWSEAYENHVDRLDLSVGLTLRKGIPQAEAEAAYAALKALPPAKGAQRLDVYWYDGQVWVTSVYPYAGMTGRKVRDLVQDFTDDYAEDHYKAMLKILKNYR